jgi:hypothetical protein
MMLSLGRIAIPIYLFSVQNKQFISLHGCKNNKRYFQVRKKQQDTQANYQEFYAITAPCWFDLDTFTNRNNSSNI